MEQRLSASAQAASYDTMTRLPYISRLVRTPTPCSQGSAGALHGKRCNKMLAAGAKAHLACATCARAHKMLDLQ